MTKWFEKTRFLTFILMLFTVHATFSSLAFADKTKVIGGDFTLTDHNRDQFELKQLRGKLVLMFFGYTFCPDICPTELSSIAKILKILGDDSNKVAALFVSIDPERDTPEKLKNYVPFFSPKLIGLTGSVSEVEAVAKAYKVQKKINAPRNGKDYYLVDHSANLYVLGANGEILHLIPFGLPIEHILRVVQEEIKKLEMSN